MLHSRQTMLCLAIVHIASTQPTTTSTVFQTRQTQNHSSIETAGLADGDVGYRREIHALREDTDAWNMYLLGLARFQEADSDDPMSFYQIAAIHGQPYVAWNNNGPCDGCTLAGYCSHQSVLFPTWHRAYLALFEKALVQNALSVAGQFSDNERERYTQAARTLRIPFWDWAKLPADGETLFPQMFIDEEVSVLSPSGPVNITNPLSGYRFKAEDEHSFMGGDETSKQPSFTANNRRQLRADLWNLLSSNQPFGAFSTEARDENDDSLNPNNLEAIHDHIHVLIGGHMSVVPQAAFDPVFWLHHTNVDRIFAIYQTAYPDRWIPESKERGSSMWYTSGTITDRTSGLEPFQSRSEGGFWTSDDLRDTRSLNYIYEDLHRQGAAPLINSLYADDGQMLANVSGSGGNLIRRAAGRYLDMSPDRGCDSNRRKWNNKTTEYIASVEVDAATVDGSFTIFIFDGDFDKEDSSGWQCDENLIGSHGFFVAAGPVAADYRLRAGISITAALSSRVLHDLSEEDSNGDAEYLAEYIKQKIDWRIIDKNGCIRGAKDFPGLKLIIVSSEVEIPPDKSRLPAWNEFNIVQTVADMRDHGCA